jgi:hypothetical protein
VAGKEPFEKGPCTEPHPLKLHQGNIIREIQKILAIQLGIMYNMFVVPPDVLI